MKTNLLIAVAVLLLFSCTKNSKQGSIYVKDFGELTKAISKATPCA